MGACGWSGKEAWAGGYASGRLARTGILLANATHVGPLYGRNGDEIYGQCDACGHLCLGELYLGPCGRPGKGNLAGAVHVDA